MKNDENISRVRAFFEDTLSLKIFEARMKCSSDIKRKAFPETLDLVGLDEIEKSRLLHFNEEILNPKREKFIYGAGVGCKYVLGEKLFTEAWTGIIDNKITGERYGLPVVSFEEFQKSHASALVFNSVGKPAGVAIQKQCNDAGIDCVSLFEFDRSWDQYFDLPHKLGLISSDEVFVQAGCFNGDTQKSYINWFGEKYAKMITFEPSPVQLALCKENLSGMRNIEIVQAGLSNRKGMARFEENQGCSCISQEGNEEIQIVSLDEYVQEQRVTFIALDIEGEELAALQGAEHIIKTHKPKLAISIYHKPEDMWELPLLIKEYNPEYQLYLRHYHLLDMAETVLYAF